MWGRVEEGADEEEKGATKEGEEKRRNVRRKRFEVECNPQCDGSNKAVERKLVSCTAYNMVSGKKA